jgi:hypothetical protein
VLHHPLEMSAYVASPKCTPHMQWVGNHHATWEGQAKMFIFKNILINTNHDFHFLDNSKANFVFKGHYN